MYFLVRHLNYGHLPWVWILICHIQMQNILHCFIFWVNLFLTLKSCLNDGEKSNCFRMENCFLCPRITKDSSTALQYVRVPAICHHGGLCAAYFLDPKFSSDKGNSTSMSVLNTRDLCQAWRPGPWDSISKHPCPRDLDRSGVPGFLLCPCQKNLSSFRLFSSRTRQLHLPSLPNTSHLCPKDTDH